MAECVVGKDKFREGLQVYLNRHKYSNTETTDLWAAWSEVSGVNMGELMNSWTSKMGYPYLKVLREAWTETECCVTLQQAWFLVDGTGDSENQLWNIPLAISSSVSSSVSNGLGRGMHADDIASAKVFERRVSLSGGDGAAWVKLNAGQAALLRVSHSEGMITRLLAPGIAQKGLSPIDRAALLDDQYALSTAGLAPVELVALLLSAYGSEDNSTVWRSVHPILLGLLGALSGLAASREGDSNAAAARDAFIQFAKQRLILPALHRLGWDARPGERDVDKLMRGSIFGLVEEFCYAEPEVAAEVKRRFNESVSAVSPSDDKLSADIKASVYRMALRLGGKSEFDAVLQIYNTATTDAVRKWGLSTLGATSVPALKNEVMEWSISGQVRIQQRN